uniref:Bromodomain adjacent to zinc finger domain 2B n=1 Tax=Myripristis murdjan TaxID=586833 RepID=A0A667Y0K7_9TELE
PVDTSGVSNSDSGTSSDSSSDGSLSSDLEDLGEDDDDDDDDDEDDDEEDKQSEMSDSEKRTKKKTKVNSGTGKTDKPHSAVPTAEPQDKRDSQPHNLVSNPPTLVPLPCSPSPPALSQSSPLTLHSSRSRPEGVQQHFSVIQSTGLAASSKPLALLTQPRREPSPSASPIALTTSPKALSSTSILSQGPTFPADVKKQQGPNRSPKRTVSSSPLPPAPPPSQNNHSNLFLSSALLGLPEPHHPNGVIQSTTQDAPLALITKPRKDSASQGKNPQCDSDAGSMPVNLSTGAGRTQANKTPKVKGQAPGLGQGQGQADPLAAWKGLSQNHLVQSLVDLFRGGESGVGIPGVSIPGVGIPGVGIPGVSTPTAGLPANKESDDSGDDDDDEDDDLEDEEDEEDSDDSLSGLGKRKRVMDEKELMTPLELGWQRETRIKTVAGRPQGEVAYYAPCGKKLRQYPDVMKYLSRNGISGITRGNFSFSAKIRVGDFYEAREGPQGLQWSLLKEEEIIPRILAMEGRRGRPPNSERQLAGEGAKGTRRRKGRPPNVGDSVAPEGPSPSEVKLLRKLEAQEIARQAAQMKLMRKLEKQALARAAKEARKQQGKLNKRQHRLHIFTHFLVLFLKFL